MIIAIDGPAGVGKSSTAKALAQTLNYTYIDTGAMYRAVALAARQKQLEAAKDAQAIATLARDLPIHFHNAGKSTFVGENDVSAQIRTPEISLVASQVAKLPEVRKVLVDKQRQLGLEAQKSTGGAVLEGRDIQTVVFPDAKVKVFLTASEDTRSTRRYKEWQEGGEKVALKDARSQLDKRDKSDTSRATAPLQPAQDAHIIATDQLSLEQVVQQILEIVSSESQ